MGGEESDFSCVSRHRAHTLKHGHPDNPGGGDEEVPEWAHVAGIASEVLGEARRMVSITTPRAAHSHHFLYVGNRGPERRGRREGGKERKGNETQNRECTHVHVDTIRLYRLAPGGKGLMLSSSMTESTQPTVPSPPHARIRRLLRSRNIESGREGGRERGKEGEREGGKEGGREGRREGGREGGKERREGGTEGGR